MTTRIRDTIWKVLNDVGLGPISEEGITAIEEAIKDELDSKGVGLVTGEAVGKPGFSYKRTAERIYRLLENQ